MRRSMLRHAMLVAVVLALVPVPVVRAADVQPILTMDPIAPTVYRGETESFTAHLSAGTTHTVTFETSVDGIDWESYSGSSPRGGDPGAFFHNGTVDGTVPLGTRYIRAHYSGDFGYLPADSEPQQQQVLIRQAEITNLSVMGHDSPLILPGTAPVMVVADSSYGDAWIDRLVDGSWEQIGGPNVGDSWVEIPAVGEGDHTFRARVDDSAYVLGATEELTISVSRAETTPQWLGDLTVQANHSLPAQVSVDGPNGGVSFEAPMTVTRVATSTVVASGDVGMHFALPAMGPGTHAFMVTYDGNASYLPSSKTFNVVVTADGVDASGVTRNYSTFYPVKDGYRDSVTMSGDRLEPASVAIRIYSPGGSLVKTATLPRAAGKYAYAWDGRTTSGAIRAAGKYKIVQTLTDAFGAARTFTSAVYLNHKKLVTKTTYVTKYGNAISAKGDPGSGSIAISTSGRYVRLTGKYPSGWVGVGYLFTLPPATVYKSIWFQVYARGELSTPEKRIGVQNFARCPYSSAAWSESCFDHWKGVGTQPLATVWHSASANVTVNRHSRTVRGIVSVPYSTHTIYKARVKVVYSVLQ